MLELDLHLDILPPAQRRVWAELTDIPEQFTLYGGTAIALQLGHRQSVDFDFFSWNGFSPLELAADLPLLRHAQILQSEPNTLSVLIDRDGPVRLSFFGLPRLRSLVPPLIARENGLRVASLLDLAGTKVATVQQRAEAKDYIDIDAIIAGGHVSLPQALAAAKQIYGAQFVTLSSLKALSWFGEPGLHSLPETLKQRLVAAVRHIDLDALPDIGEHPPA